MSKRKLLLADDSITIQKVVNLTFADEGIEVITVGDGDAAMQKFVADTPDLVMADVNMPGVDGYRICEMIKQDDETKHIPVILLVGSFEPFDEEEARRVGADDYLTKPFQSIRQLVNKVTELLNSANGEAPANIEETAQSESSYTETAELGDAGMDDEMIQTNQIGSLPIDEPQKFEADSAASTFADIPPTTLRSPYQTDFGSSTQHQSGGDFAKTQPLTTQEFRDIIAPVAEDEAVPSEEKGYEIAEEQDYEQAEIVGESNITEPEIADSQSDFEPQEIDEQQYVEPEYVSETEQTTVDETEPTDTDESKFAPSSEMSETVPMPEAASVLDLDEMNLLELPPHEKKVSPDFQTAPVEPQEYSFQTAPVEPQEFETAEEEPAAETAETLQTEQSEVDEYFETISDSTELINLSPQSIEAIAARVADLVLQKLAQASIDEN